MKNILKRPLSRFNSELMKRYNIGFVANYPLRTSIKFALEYFKGRKITCAEIGTYRGENALYILEKLNIKKIYLIDPWEKYPGYNEYDKDKLRRYFLETKKRLRKYSDKIVYMMNLSKDASKEISEKLDFVYVDGNHDYEYVKEDMELYWNKLAKGGILAGHDISWPGVGKAFCEFVEKKGLEPNIANMDWWVIKK